MYCVGVLRCHAITYLPGRCTAHAPCVPPSEGGFVTSRIANSMYPKLPNNCAARLLIFQKKKIVNLHAPFFFFLQYIKEPTRLLIFFHHLQTVIFHYH